jgi:hypothetical protein
VVIIVITTATPPLAVVPTAVALTIAREVEEQLPLTQTKMAPKIVGKVAVF